MPEGPIPLPDNRLDELVHLANRVFRGNGGDMGSEYPLVFDSGCPQGMRVVLEDGKVVSHVGVCVRDASLLGVTLRVASIGAVCTDPDYRGRGFAGALMEDAAAYALQQKAQVMLISGDRPLYRRFGAVRPGRFTQIEVAESDLSPGYALDGAGEADIPDLIRLYQREPVRFHRSHNDWARLMHAQMLMNAPADLWMVRDSDDTLAYVAVQRPGGDNVPTVREYAGSREAVWATLGALAQGYGASSIRVCLMPEDVDMAGRARRAEAMMHLSGFGGTVKVVDVAEMVRRVLPLWIERAGFSAVQSLGIRADRTGLSYTRDGQEVRLEGPEATLSFFGPEIRSESDANGLPGIEPLPLFWYGYNYV